MALWAGLGLALSYYFFRRNQKIKKATKILAVGFLGSITGGLFGFLFNGIPNLGSSINNLTTSLIFAGGFIFLILPKQRGKEAK